MQPTTSRQPPPHILYRKSLYEAIENNDEEKAKGLLVDQKFSNRIKLFIDYADEKIGQTPLQRASMKGQFMMVKMLLDAGATVDYPENETKATDAYSISTPLQYAVGHGHTKIVALLLERGANPNPRCNQPLNKLKSSPLHSAAFNNFQEIAAALLQKGAWPNSTDIRGYTPLSWAIINDQSAMIPLLAYYNANLYKNGPNHPLTSAIQQNSLSSVKALFANGLSLRKENYIVLYNAIKHSSKSHEALTILHLLIKRGADIYSNQRIQFPDLIISSTPLKYAAKRNDLSATKLLLAFGKYDQYKNDPIWKNLSFYSSEMNGLLTQYKMEPNKIKRECRLEIEPILQIQDHSNIFALMVLHSDGFLQFTPPPAENRTNSSHLAGTAISSYFSSLLKNSQRFFTIAEQLPLELQMLLANRYAFSSENQIPLEKRQTSLQEMARSFISKDS
jgi:ankyrin repeat protein